MLREFDVRDSVIACGIRGTSPEGSVHFPILERPIRIVLAKDNDDCLGPRVLMRDNAELHGRKS